MKTETIQVTVEGTVQASLSLYIQEDYPDTYGERKRPLVLICPGGGYEHVSVREGEPVALHFLTAAVMRQYFGMISQNMAWHILRN